jgi:acyl-CoA thioester hydrolase
LGILVPVIDVKLCFLKPIYCDDLVTIKMQLNLMSPTKLSIDYRLHNSPDEVIHMANTLLTFIKKTTKKPCRVPAFMEEVIMEQVVTY